MCLHARKSDLSQSLNCAFSCPRHLLTSLKVRMAIEPITKSYTWDLPEIKERNTMHLVEYPVNEEVGLDWPKNGGEFYIVYSDKKNAWGERKGYRTS